MSFPNIPDTEPEITIDKEDSVALIISSIAMEEPSLSHLLNSEAEKICYILGELKDQCPPKHATFHEIMKVNRSVNTVLRDIIKKEMLLQFKLENAKEILSKKCEK